MRVEQLRSGSKKLVPKMLLSRIRRREHGFKSSMKNLSCDSQFMTYASSSFLDGSKISTLTVFLIFRGILLSMSTLRRRIITLPVSNMCNSCTAHIGHKNIEGTRIEALCIVRYKGRKGWLEINSQQVDRNGHRGRGRQTGIK